MNNKKIVSASIIFFVIISFGITAAAASIYDESMSRGKAFLEEKRYGEAAEEFRKALNENKDDQAANLYLGIALDRLGNREAEHHLKKALSINPSDPRTNLEMGIYYQNRRIYAEARDYFENIRDLAPGSEYSVRAERYLREISGVREEKPWSLGISLGEQYDSNVIINPDGDPVPEGISRKSDWKSLIFLDGRVKFIRNEKLEASLGYSFYQTLNYNLSDFNITQNLADLSFRLKVLPALSLGGMYKFEYVLVGGDHYDTAHSAGPSIIISEGKGFFTELQYVYRYTHFKDSGLFTDNSDRTGPNNYIGLAQTIPLGRMVKAEVGYSYDKDRAREDFWRYEGNRAYASVNFTFPRKFFLNLFAEYYKKRYEGIGPFSDAARRDEVRTYSVSLTKFFTDRLGVTLGETFVDNGSNIDVFKYRRSLTTLLLNVRF